MSYLPNRFTLAAGSQLDAFGRLRTSQPKTLFDSQQEYGLDTLRLWDACANGTLSYSTGSTNGSITDGAGNSVGPRNANSRMVPITVTATDGHYSILQSRQYPRYIPGKSHLVMVTGVFAATADYDAAIVLRTSTSGSASDTRRAAMADWNGKDAAWLRTNLDLTKTQILIIDAQWLGVGEVYVYFDIGRVYRHAHTFQSSNVLTLPYTQSFNLPVRLEARTGASSTVYRAGLFDHANGVFLETESVAGGTMNFVCCSVQTEGGEEMRGFPMAVGSASSITVTTRRPVLSIRPKTTFNSLTNRAHIELAELELTAQTNSSYWELVIGGTLTGAAFASVNANSVVEYDTTATAISGGLTIMNGFVVTGSGVAKGTAAGQTDTRGPLTLSQIDALTATQPNLSLVCTTLGGNSVITSAMHWHEQTV